MAKFIRGKRLVEAFGVEHESTSEEETIGVHYRYVGGKRQKSSAGFIYVTGSQPDYDHPEPSYRREVHNEACRAAANRVVRRWKESTAQALAA